MYCQSRLCLEGKQLGGRQAQNCNVILAAIFTGEKGGGGEIKKKKKNIGGLKLVRHCGVNTTENNDPELRFIGTESGTSLITKGQMSSLLAVSLVAGGAAFFFFFCLSFSRPSLCFFLSISLSHPFFSASFLHVL